MSLIFLSHTEKDFPLAEEIARGLEDAGYSTWYYERDTLPGTSYLLQITRAIEACDAMVLIASSNSISSDQVTKEVIYAFEGSRALFPVLTDVTPAQMKELQPEWGYALGGSAMVTLAPEDPSPTVSSIINGLKAMDINPGETKAPATPVLSTTVVNVPKTLTNRVLAQRASLEGERKQVTVLCAEVTGLSAMDPEDRHGLMGLLTDLVSEEVHYYEGTVAQVSGAGFTALFGAPISHEDDPARALHAALAIKEQLEQRQEKLSLRAGLNTGLVIVGAIGDDLSMEYTAIGETVNLASQILEGAASGEVLASEETYELTQGYFDFEPSDVPEAFRVLSPRKTVTRVEASMEKGLSHFVGRQGELARLSECLQKASEGQGQVVGIVGEPGVGKSRLVHEFTASLPEGDCTVLRGGCYHYGDAIPYLPVLEVLKDYFSTEDCDDQDSIREKIETAVKLADADGKLEGILPPLHELFSLPMEDDSYLELEPLQRRERVFAAVRQLLTTESQKCPLVLVVEDLHWIDRTSEEFLASLIDGITNSHILLILLYRPEYTSPWTSKSYYNQISLDQLPEKTSEELISSILSEGAVSPEITGLIVGKASGNPLFIEELTHGLLENGSITKENERYALSGSPSQIEVPDTIQGIIAARLDRLQEDLKRLMQAASVIGREFAYRLLEAITQMQMELQSSLAELQGLEFIYEKSLFPELEYIFKHALTQEVAYNSLLKKKRRELHGSIGNAIEALYPDRLEEHYEMLAYHYARSDDTDKAIHYLKLSGDKAAGSYSNWEAVSFYTEALKIYDSLSESEEWAREKIAFCFAIYKQLTFLNYPEGSLEILQKAEALAKELDDEQSLIRVYRRLANYHTLTGNNFLGMEYSEKCIEVAETIGAVDSMAQSANAVSSVHFAAGDMSKVADTTQRALRIIQEEHREKDLTRGGFNLFSQLSGWCGLALGWLGRFEEGREVLRIGLETAREVNDVYGMGFIEICHYPVCGLSGDGHSSVKHAQKAIEYFEQTGIEVLLGWAWGFLSNGYFLLGDYETARDYGEKSLKLQKKSGLPYVLPVIYWNLSLIQLAMKDYESAKASSEEALKLAKEFNAGNYEVAQLGLHGRITGEADPTQLDIAEGYIRRGISMGDELKVKPIVACDYLLLGETFEIAGRKEDAIKNLKIAEKMGLELGTGYWLDRTREALARLER
jgi:class 3 adenylate cyclase/tetratricopeptide (TPR) repeat protein